jgi:uncharacterized protein
MGLFNNIFNQDKPVIAMIHLQALPGTPKNQLKPEQIIENALAEAQILFNNRVDALMIENMHDVPYTKGKASPEVIAIMAIVAHQIKQKFQIPVGMQILAGANCDAIGAAFGAGIDFIRAEGFVYGHLADEGYFDSCAAELLRYRKNIGALQVAIFTDIKKKHSSHAITNDVSIVETAKATELFLSDGLVITGCSTGIEPSETELKEVKKNSVLPIIIGSGINIENIDRYYPLADAFIIGSHFKINGLWPNNVDEEKVARFVKYINKLKLNG